MLKPRHIMALGGVSALLFAFAPAAMAAPIDAGTCPGPSVPGGVTNCNEDVYGQVNAGSLSITPQTRLTLGPLDQVTTWSATHGARRWLPLVTQHRLPTRRLWARTTTLVPATDGTPPSRQLSTPASMEPLHHSKGVQTLVPRLSSVLQATQTSHHQRFLRTQLSVASRQSILGTPTTPHLDRLTD